MNEAPPSVDITPECLRDARTKLNLNRAEAARLLSEALTEENEPAIGPDLLELWELGQEKPNLVQAEAAAEVYFVPFPWLFRDKLPVQPIVDFRLSGSRKPHALGYEVFRGLSRFDDYYRVGRRITQALAISENDVTVPTPGRTGLDAVEAVGEQLRRALGITDEVQLAWTGEEAAAADIRSRIESTGTFVFSTAMPLSECRGASQWESGGPPAILVNSADSHSAQLFTMVHEFVHLMTRQVASGPAVCDPSSPPTVEAVNPEQFANRVAAAALVPPSLLELALPSKSPPGSYRDWPESLRRNLKRVFKVSQDVIGIRLFHLKRADAPQWSRSFWRQPSSDPRGRSMTGADRVRRALGERTLRLGAKAVRSELVAPFELKRALRVKMEDLNSAMGI